jgi:hypothetical protein
LLTGAIAMPRPHATSSGSQLKDPGEYKWSKHPIQKRRRRISPAEWKKHKELILQHFDCQALRKERHAFQHVAEFMREKHDFIAEYIYNDSPSRQ